MRSHSDTRLDVCVSTSIHLYGTDRHAATDISSKEKSGGSLCRRSRKEARRYPRDEEDIIVMAKVT